MKKIINIFLTVFILLVFTGTGVYAIDYSPRTIGKGGTGGIDTGIAALNVNPAGVHLDNRGRYSLEFGGTADLWNNLFYNDHIGEDEKEGLLAGIEDSGLAFGTNSTAGPRFRLGPVAGFDGSITIFSGVRAEGLARLSPDLAELILVGNEVDKTYEIDGSDGAGGVFAEIGAGLAYDITDQLETDNDGELELERLLVGSNLHYLTGTIFELESSGQSTLFYDEDDELRFQGDGTVNFNYHNPADYIAGGVALDAGLMAEFNDEYRAGISIQNLLGSVKVDGGEFYRVDFDFDLDSTDQDFEEYIEEEEGELTAGYSYRLPRIIRLAGAWAATDWAELSGEIAHTGYQNDVSDIRLAVGGESTYISQIPMRMGINYSTLRNNFAVNTGAGLHLGPLKIDFGISDLTGLFRRSRGVSAGASVGLEW